MNFFTTILASFMLSLFLFSGTGKATAKTLVVKYAAGNSGSEQGSHEENDCTPFCAVCSCCQVVETKTQVPQQIAVMEVANVSTSPFISIRPKDISLPVWHPPQLS